MNHIFQSKVVRGFLSLVLLVPLFVGSLSQHSPISFSHGIDAYAHWGGFFAVSMAIFFLEYDRPISTFVIMIFLAISLELGQAFLETRVVDALDAKANLIGVLGGFATAILCRKWIFRRQSR
jgi:VanZ family protein